MRLNQRKYAALALLLVAASTVQGCAPYKLAKTPITKAYVALDDYKIAQGVGISIGSDPLTPRAVTDGIKRADAIANPAAHASTELVEEYRQARADVLIVEQSGKDPTLQAVEKAQIALVRLQNALTKLRPFIKALEAAARGVK